MKRQTNSRVSEFPNVVDFGREICGDLHSAGSREWLVTNGIGGYALGTIAGHLTRCYHGLLMAALRPPLGRTLLVSKLDEEIEYTGQRFELSTNRWLGGAIAPDGFRHIERFHLEGSVPVWTFALADALLEKRIFMKSGENTTYVMYRLTRGSGPIEVKLKALVNYAGEHCTTKAGDWRMDISPVENGLRVTAFPGAVPFYLLLQSAKVQRQHNWYRDFDLAGERARGLTDRTDHLLAGEFSATLTPGQSLTMVASTESAPSLNGDEALAACHAGAHVLLDHFFAHNMETAPDAPPAIHQLVLAADQFIAVRPVESVNDSRTILAGFPWFGDWGRDTMISLPGLCLTTGRAPLARNILRTFARFVSGGMLPNHFPSEGETPEYNSVDAALWYFESIREYIDATGDLDLLRELYPVLVSIIDAHVHGTRHNIQVDANDGLLYAGETGVQPTWMDAKIGNFVVTPRIGKPVEVNALWLNALLTMSRFARLLGSLPTDYDKMAQRTRTSFDRFWNHRAQFCFDVIDGPPGSETNDAALRPNQILAVSLPESALTSAQQRSIVDVCARELLTSFGLRSLSPRDREYQGKYGGDPDHRDRAYHQGTVWGWLLGPFVMAHHRVYQNADKALSFLEPMYGHLRAAGLGTASEIFDGDAPFNPDGCIAQAWTVAEILRVWGNITQSRNITGRAVRTMR